MNAKLQEIIFDHGIEGYGLYWYCLELVAQNVTTDNLTFELEHDARIIGRNIGMPAARVQEIMKSFIANDLFSASEGRIQCLKLAQRCDDFTAKAVRSKGVKSLKNQGVRLSPTNSEKVPLEVEVEVEKNKHSGQQVDLEDVIKNEKNKIPVCQHEKIIEIYHEVLPELPKTIVHLWGGARKKNLNARWKEYPQHQDLEFWRFYFGLVRQSSFHMGDNDRGWQADLEWLVKQTNFAKILGKYA